MSDVALRRLRELRSESDAIGTSWQDSGKFKAWHLSVETALTKLLGETSPYLTNFRDIWWVPGVTYDDTSQSDWDEAFMRGVDEAKGILDSAIRAAEDYGFAAPRSLLAATSAQDSQSLPSGLPPSPAPPDNILQALLRLVWQLPPTVRVTIIVVLAALVAAAALFALLPDRTKESIVSFVMPSRESVSSTTTSVSKEGSAPVRLAATPPITIANKLDINLTNAQTNEYAGTFELSIDNQGATLAEVSWVQVDLYIGHLADNAPNELMTQINGPPGELFSHSDPGPIVWLRQSSLGYLHPRIRMAGRKGPRPNVSYQLGGPARDIHPSESSTFPIPILVRAPRDRWVGVVATFGLDGAVAGQGVFSTSNWKDLRATRK